MTSSSNECRAKILREKEASSKLKENAKVDLETTESSSTVPRWSVQDVAANLPGGPPVEASNSPIPFFHLLERLKTTPREGWRRFGVKNAESISDHMYRMALMTLLVPKSLANKIDVQHCTKMALVHDMAEALVGDITPVEGVSKLEKNYRESTTMDFLTKNILGNVEGGEAAADIRAIWQEYEDSKTLESQCVHDIDKVELILQMIEYERSYGCKYDLGELTWVTCKIKLPEIRVWAQAILDEREELWGGQEHVSYTAIGDPNIIEAEMLSKSLPHCVDRDVKDGTNMNGYVHTNTSLSISE